MTRFDPAAPLEARAAQALEFAQEQVRALISNHPDYFPLYTEDGKWQHGREAWTNWCEGFLGGMMWIFAAADGDQYWRERAEHYSLLIEERQHDTSVHDLGFVFWSTWKRWFDLTGDQAIKARVIQAGRTMGLRFNEEGKYLRSFVAPESCFIDIMMNVGIIFYAANRNRRRRSAAQSDRALPDDAAVPGAWRRQHRARGDLRPADGRVPARIDPPGMARRFLLGARADLGALRIRHCLPVLGRRAVPGYRRALRRFLHRAHASTRRAAERLGRAVSAATLRELGRGHRRQRPAAACRADARSGASDGVQRATPGRSSTRSSLPSSSRSRRPAGKASSGTAATTSGSTSASTRA